MLVPIVQNQATVDSDYVDKRTNTNNPNIVTLVAGQDDELATDIPASCTISADTINYKVGDRGLKMTVAGAASPSVRWDFTSPNNVIFPHGPQSLCMWIYLPDASKVTALGLTLYTGDLSEFWGRSVYSYITPVNGWNFVRIPAVNGNIADWGSCGRMYLTATTTDATSITYGHVYAEYSDRMKVLIVSDAYYDTFRTEAYPAFKARGIPVTAAINPTLMGDTSAAKDTSTLAQLTEFYNDGNGNAVSAHSWARTAMLTLTDAEVRTDVIKCIKWLEQNGFQRGKEWRAAWTQNTANNAMAASDMLLGARTYESIGGVSCWPPMDIHNMPAAGMMEPMQPSYTDGVNSDMDTLFAQMDTTNGFMIAYFHGITSGPLTGDTTPANFAYFLSLLDSRIASDSIEFHTFGSLIAESGYKFRQGVGPSMAEYYDDGVEVLKRLP